MALATLGGALLRVGNSLALSIACCCNRLFCRQVREDECGNAVYDCDNQQQGSIGPCTESCRPPEDPCECGPTLPCDVCYECIDRKCERIEDCCADGSPCPECQKCVNGVCVPCGECEKCVDGVCVPCGPCEKCEGGECVPCDSDEDCVEGECVPKQYYCCWDECPNDEYGDPKDPPPSTHCQNSPCGTGLDDNDEPCDLTKGGPYNTSQLCDENCQNYDCVPDACGYRECQPDPDGEYDSKSECLADCPADPCAEPCSFAGASTPGIYSIDGCERDICVSYVSPDSRPIRVQIWGPTLDNNCNIIASRVIKADSDWRGEECCDCDSRPAGDLEGGPKGQITWTKPRGVTSFEVAVLTACGATANIDIRCSDDCGDPPDPDMCPCEDDGDCNDGCHCCDGECQDEPCEECEPCEDCDVVAAAAEQSDVDCTPPFEQWQWFKTQLVSEIGGGDPAVADSWADGYPEALADCRMFLVQDVNRTEGSCTCDIFLDGNFVENICASAGWTEARNRLMVLRCPDGEEAYLEDVTDDAIVTGSERAEPVEPGGDIPSKWAGYTLKDTDCLLEQPDPPRLICEGGEPDWYDTPTDWLPDPTVECDP
jgi:hypothetical protein